nr:hypothetical protein BaRGS_033609 [Batillaria attramentaria]
MRRFGVPVHFCRLNIRSVYLGVSFEVSASGVEQDSVFQDKDWGFFDLGLGMGCASLGLGMGCAYPGLGMGLGFVFQGFSRCLETCAIRFLPEFRLESFFSSSEQGDTLRSRIGVSSMEGSMSNDITRGFGITFHELIQSEIFTSNGLPSMSTS